MDSSNKHPAGHTIAPCESRYAACFGLSCVPPDAPKPFLLPGFIPLLIGCGCLVTLRQKRAQCYRQQTKGQRQDLQLIRQELERVNQRLVKARNLLIDDELDPVEYKTVKNECERKIAELESRLLNTNTPDSNIEALIRKAVEGLGRLEELWEQATAEKKRQILGLIYPEKLVFDGKSFQTARINEGVRLIYLLNEGFSENEKGQMTEKTALSYSVTRIGFKHR